MADEQYVLVSAHPEEVDGGRTLIPGEAIGLTKDELEQPAAKRLIDEGLLITLEAKKTKRPSKAEEEDAG